MAIDPSCSWKRVSKPPIIVVLAIFLEAERVEKQWRVLFRIQQPWWSYKKNYTFIRAN
jgi:hypothetical protein